VKNDVNRIPGDPGVLYCGVVWCVMVWCGVLWCGVVCYGVVWCGVMVWCGVLWYGVLCYGVVWSGMVCCGVVHPALFTLSEQFPHMPNKEIKARGVLQVSPF